MKGKIYNRFLQYVHTPLHEGFGRLGLNPPLAWCIFLYLMVLAYIVSLLNPLNLAVLVLSKIGSVLGTTVIGALQGDSISLVWCAIGALAIAYICCGPKMRSESRIHKPEGEVHKKTHAQLSDDKNSPPASSSFLHGLDDFRECNCVVWGSQEDGKEQSIRNVAEGEAETLNYREL